MKPNVLSIAAASGRIGYVYLQDGELRDWGLSVVAARNEKALQKKMKQLLETYRPDLIITEKLSLHTRKSGRTLNNISTIEQIAQNHEAHHIQVEHLQHYANKYEEMVSLGHKYPVLANWIPKPRRLWESENRNTVIWEALAFVDQADI